ncbi:MAG: 3H domain-containing protein [Anaerovoracaceae bacterium]
MTGKERRENILKSISESSSPLSASKIADMFGVSRQVVVQDIALIRAAGHEILSTNRGYILQNPVPLTSRVFKVSHTEEELEDELTVIVDLGGNILDVVVNHKLYGRMQAPLNISSRRNITSFMNNMKSGKSTPLMRITSNYHYHTVEADSEETLDLIEQALRERGYLIEPLVKENK